jgi:hypothetical protein
MWTQSYFSLAGNFAATVDNQSGREMRLRRLELASCLQQETHGQANRARSSKRLNAVYGLCFFFLSVLPGAYGGSYCEKDTMPTVRSVIDDFRPSLLCTEGNNNWELLHHIVAYGENASIMTSRGPLSAIRYLCREAQREDLSPLFAVREDGSLVPVTDAVPRQRNQDHRNQIMAVIGQAMAEKSGTAECPKGIKGQEWTRMVAGVWVDYTLDEDPSWTLMSYIYYFQELPAPRQQVTERICQMLTVLTSPDNEVPLACKGTHALHALAVYLNSPGATFVPRELNVRVQQCLQAAARNFLQQHSKRYLEKSRVGPGFSTMMQRSNLILYEYGHALEWLVEYLSASELQGPVVSNVAEYLAATLENRKEFEFKGLTYGRAAHSIRALRVYLEKVDRHQHARPLNTDSTD